MMESCLNQIKNIALRYRDKPIFIIGKGASLDSLPEKFRPSGLTININDSELIVQGDICIATEHWVCDQLQSLGPRCAVYLVNRPLGLPNEIVLDPASSRELEDDSLVIERLAIDDLFAEEIGLINAIKICRLLSIEFKKAFTVYMLGFDFGFIHGEQSLRIKEIKTDSKRYSKIKSQENIFIQMMHYFTNGGYGQLVHVGDKPYSSMNSISFFQKVAGVKWKKREIPTTYLEAIKQPALITAEITNNHLGDADRLKLMVRLIKNAGADLIKLQKRNVDTFYTKEKLESYYWSPFGDTFGDYRRGVELSPKDFKALDEECRLNNISWFCSILDEESFNFMQQFPCNLIKLPSTISEHTNFHRIISEAYQGGIVISTGMTDQNYEKNILELFSKNNPLFLLQCTSTYPTPAHACNLNVIHHYRSLSQKYSKLIPGYSSHDNGSLGSMLAISAGVKMIEKHVKMGDVEWIHFDKVAIDLQSNAFTEYISDIRRAETYLGSDRKKIQPEEYHKYHKIN